MEKRSDTKNHPSNFNLFRSLGRMRTFSSFKNRNYRFYFGGVLGHMACMNMQQIPNGLLLERLTNSPVIVGAMALSGAIPMLILSFLGGVIADRVEKKYLIVVGQAGFALTSLITAIALSIGYVSAEHPGSWWVLVVISAVQGCVMGIAMPARQAVLSDIVHSEDLMNAISLNFLGTNALQVAAPVIAGFMVNAFNFDSVYYTMTFLYLISMVMFAFMPRTGIKATGRSNALVEIKNGLKYVWNHQTVRLVMLISFLTVLLSSPYSLLMPFFADDILKVGASGMGILFSVSGIGAIVASVVLASLPNRKRGMMMLIASFLVGIALIGFAASKSMLFSLGLIAIVGIGNTITMTLCNTLVQYLSDDAHRGRVMSLFIMQFALSSVSNFGSSFIAQEFGVQWAVGSFAIVLVLFVGIALTFIPQIRKLN
jgi:MFS family permease